MLEGEAGRQTEEPAWDTPSEGPAILALYLILHSPLVHRLNRRSMNFQENVKLGLGQDMQILMRLNEKSIPANQVD